MWAMQAVPGGYTTASTAAAALCEAGGSHGPVIN